MRIQPMMITEQNANGPNSSRFAKLAGSSTLRDQRGDRTKKSTAAVLSTAQKQPAPTPLVTVVTITAGQNVTNWAPATDIWVDSKPQHHGDPDGRYSEAVGADRFWPQPGEIDID